MENFIVVNKISSLSAEDIQGWKSLFIECFNKSSEAADAVFRKYIMHPDSVWMCLARKNGKLVACYSGIALKFGHDEIFLVTDTMSNGQISGATVKMARVLYPALSAVKIGAVCGFPNSNIVKIRERKLGWKIIGHLHFYIGIPFLWRLGWLNSNLEDIWYLHRPKEGFYSKTWMPLSLVGRGMLYEGGWFAATLSSKSPGPFFIKVPKILVAPKNFGYALIRADISGLAMRLERASNRLDLNSIDVP
jgi:hypothetical protein